MTTETAARSAAVKPPGANGWYGVAPAEVATRIGVDTAVGLTSQQAARLLEQHGPNALPAEPPVPAWKRFLGQYRTYMQLILVADARRRRL
jgi:P-type Ca2+ transporter type 2C